MESRPDIDHEKLVYCGFSPGGLFGPFFLATEDRLRAGILAVGGLVPGGRPEVNRMNDVTRINIPTLMLNGRYDMTFPLRPDGLEPGTPTNLGANLDTPVVLVQPATVYFIENNGGR